MEKIYRLGHGRAPVSTLATGNDFGRTLGCHYFARACFLPTAADWIQGLAFHAHKISHYEGKR
jgi:hypothetical protein